MAIHYSVNETVALTYAKDFVSEVERLLNSNGVSVERVEKCEISCGSMVLCGESIPHLRHAPNGTIRVQIDMTLYDPSKDMASKLARSGEWNYLHPLSGQRG